MKRIFFTITNDEVRQTLIRLMQDAPIGTRVTMQEAKRSLPQNDRMWAMLGDVASQLKWHGETLEPDDWKLLFIDALKREYRTMPSLDGHGFVMLGTGSSSLSREEMSDLIELIFMFGDNHKVAWGDPYLKSQIEQMKEDRR